MVSLKKHIEDVDKTSSKMDAGVPELSRPRRQYKEDQRAARKPQGRKRTQVQSQCKHTNWQSPFLWSQIEVAAVRAGKPWSPRAITKEAQKLDRVIFARLTEQVVGRWIDADAKKRGVSKWTKEILDHVAKGNSPRGESTRAGILVSSHVHLSMTYF
jgi:hypothetical protein